MLIPKRYNLSRCLLWAVLATVALWVVYLVKLYYVKQCKWSSIVGNEDTVCRIFNHGRIKEQHIKNIGSVIVQSVIDKGNMTVAERSKFQNSQVDRFCAKYNLTKQLFLPEYRGHPVYRHLLVNGQAETLFCFVPKVGCTHLKVLYFIAQGLLPESVADTHSVRRVKDAILRDIVASNSLFSLNKEKCDELVNEYYKFIMYRHPLERLVSAYKSKVQRLPLKGILDEEPHYNWLRKQIYKYTHPQEYKKWLQNGGEQEIHISFSDFVIYWHENENYRTKHDEHLMPIFDLCAPCSVRYHYYGNFETFEQDAGLLVEMIGTKMSNLRQGYYSENQKGTTARAEGFYNELTTEQKMSVLMRLSQDLHFYYHLFPVQKDSHKRMLNISTDLPVP